MSMHFTWKPWRHFGSTLMSSPSRNSPRQIGQSVARIWIPESYAAIGIRHSFFFSSGANPLNLPAVCSGDSEANRLLLLYLKAHLTIKFSARAESRTTRMITMLVSKFPPLWLPLFYVLLWIMSIVINIYHLHRIWIQF